MLADGSLRSIFVTGIHRSGTHWIGKMLACSRRPLIKDEEIFNCEDNITRSPIRQMYLHICKENEEIYLPFVRAILEHHYSLIGGLGRLKTARDIGRVLKRKGRSIYRRFSRFDQMIIVEPIGLLSAEWFARTFNALPVVMIRHPASFISSLKRYDWGFDFSYLLDQELLMRGHLHEFRDDLKTAPAKSDLIGQGILLWKVMYSVVADYQKKHSDWLFVKQEEIAADPVEGFKRLYDRLGLPFTDDRRNTILEYSSPENPPERAIKRNEDSKRDSRQTVNIWKKRLTKSEIDRIHKGVHPVSVRWYTESDWS